MAEHSIEETQGVDDGSRWVPPPLPKPFTNGTEPTGHQRRRRDGEIPFPSLLSFPHLKKEEPKSGKKKNNQKKNPNKKPNKLVFSSVLESTWINNGSRTRAAGTINFLCPRPKKEAAAALPAAGVQREEDAARRLIVGRGWWGWGAQLCFAL